MASPALPDLDVLLAPFPGDNPAGVDPRAEASSVSDYHTIRDARKAASGVERRNDQGDDAGPPDWKSVVDRGRKILSGKAKDAEITGYLIEGLVRTNGFTGLADGFQLALGLIENFWDTIYPDPGETDYESRFSALFWLSGIDRPGTLIIPIRKIPFTKGNGDVDYTLVHHQQASALDLVGDAKARQKRVDAGAITMEMIRRAVSQTPPAFFGDLMADLERGRTLFLRFCETFAARSGFDPPSSDLLGVLESYEEVVRDLARDRIPKVAAPAAAAAEPEPVVEATPAAGAASAAATAAPAMDPMVIRDRADAMDRLRKVVDYFRENEPQSVIPYALEQVIGWGTMSLPELLATLIPDDSSRKNLFKQVGIPHSDD